jgi:ankyrin repeat protein
VLHLVFEGWMSRIRHMSGTEQTEDAVPVHLRSSLKNCLRLFAARGARIGQRDVMGNSPLAYALVYGHAAVLPTLFDMAAPKNANLWEQVSYRHVMPVKPACQESDYDESVHGSEPVREPGDKMSAAEKQELEQVNRWKKQMAEYRRRERSFSSFRGSGMSALHYVVSQGKLELVRSATVGIV